MPNSISSGGIGKITSQQQNDRVGAAPLWKIDSAGTRIDVPGYRNLVARNGFGSTTETIEPKEPAKPRPKLTADKRGEQVDVFA